MGSGIAKIVKDKWPKAYQIYKQEVLLGKLKIGQWNAWWDTSKDIVIVNLITQQEFGRDKAKTYVNYDAVTEGIWKIIKEEENMTTKLKPFNLEKALAGEKVVTRDGRNVVEIVKLSKAVGSQSVIAVKEDGNWASYSSDGYLWSEGSLSDNDLFMAPTKKQGWVNIYKQVGNTYVATVYLSEEEALQNRCIISLVDTVMIEWEE